MLAFRTEQAHIAASVTVMSCNEKSGLEQLKDMISNMRQVQERMTFLDTKMSVSHTNSHHWVGWLELIVLIGWGPLYTGTELVLLGRAAVDDAPHAWLCVPADPRNKTPLVGHLRLCPTPCSTLRLASASHTCIHTSSIHNCHTTPPARTVIRSLSPRLTLFFSCCSLIQRCVLTWGSFLMRSIICCFQPELFLSVRRHLNRPLSVFGIARATARNLPRIPCHHSSLVFRLYVTTDRYEQSGTGGHAWTVYWSVPVLITSIQHQQHFPSMCFMDFPQCSKTDLWIYDSSPMNWWSTARMRPSPLQYLHLVTADHAGAKG